jgi:prepilin-type N-terminal cleavage/methylation domain-containing protein
MVTGGSVKNRDGFSLLEVMIALSIFSFFITVYITSEGYNLSDSSMMREEIILRNLCENKINQLLVNPPELKESLTLTADKGTFKDNPNYSYEIEYKHFTIPDLSSLNRGEEENSEDGQQNAIKKMIFKQVETHIKELVWQVRVTVTNKDSGFPFTLSTWIYNGKAKVNIAL